MFGGKKAKELEEELLALQEKQNRLQEQISNIAKAKDSAEETLVQMTISKTEHFLCGSALLRDGYH